MRIPLRSMLFVPGDSEKKLGKAADAPADALVLDLEDSVASGRKDDARRMVAEYLASGRARPGLDLWVRINPLSGPYALDDLSAIVGANPAGILLPKAEGPEDVQRVSHYLDALEARDGPGRRMIEIIAVATETAGSTFALADYRKMSLRRLYGLTWGAEDLSTDIGAATNKDATGELALTYRMVRSTMLVAAKAAGVQALETAYPDFRDLARLSSILDGAWKEGFTGGFAIHPAQIEPLNTAFTPAAEDIALAEKVVAAFASAEDVGTIGIDGRMYDRPHLVQAQKILALRDVFAR